ncbi:MAG: hypothetical protein EXS39_07200 [Opitutaceae bacterium]|nr:hypothetical protein [Opitutaceae bacterium]
MKFRTIIAWSSVLFLAAPALPAEDPVRQLQLQLRQLQEEFEQTRRQQQQQIEALTKKLEALTNAPPAAAASAPPGTDERKKLEQELAAATVTRAAVGAAGTTPRGEPAAMPAPGARAGSAYMNISYGTLIDAGWSTAADPAAQLQLGDHDPIKRGFALRNAEIAVDGAVDPYFKGFASLVLKLDKNNETAIELEESFLQSSSLPANLQLKAGQFFASFGRQNPQHPHTWAFVDQPLILSRAFGPEGLRSIGAQLSWLAPTPFYTEFFLSVLDGQGGTAFSFRNPGEPDATGVHRFAGRATFDRTLRGAPDLLFVPRIAFSLEPTDTTTLLAGLSGAFGPNNTDPHSRTEVYGADFFWKWKPPTAAQGFPFVTWQTEALVRRFGAAADPLAPVPLRAETLRDSGVYSQLVYGFLPRWNAGVRADYVTGNAAAFDASDPFRGERYRFSPELTFLPSEFSKIRLQYNHDHGDLFGTAHSIWMQLEFGLGAHTAHKY